MKRKIQNKLTTQTTKKFQDINFIPVSYTHLDVYKRQLRGHCSRTQSVCTSQPICTRSWSLLKNIERLHQFCTSQLICTRSWSLFKNIERLHQLADFHTFMVTVQEHRKFALVSRFAHVRSHCSRTQNVCTSQPICTRSWPLFKNCLLYTSRCV